MSYFITHRFPSLLSIWVLLRRMDSVILGINRRPAMALGSMTQRNTKYLRLQQLCEAQISQCSDWVPIPSLDKELRIPWGQLSFHLNARCGSFLRGQQSICHDAQRGNGWWLCGASSKWCFAWMVKAAAWPSLVPLWASGPHGNHEQLPLKGARLAARFQWESGRSDPAKRSAELTVAFGDSFNQWLTGVNLPNSLTFGDRLTRACKESAYRAVQTSIFGIDFNQGLDGVTLPCSLQSLAFGCLWNYVQSEANRSQISKQSAKLNFRK